MPTTSSDEARDQTRLRLALALAALAGFISLSYEILWYRVLSIMTRGVASTFGLLLAAYLLGLAVGSWASTFFCKHGTSGPGQLRVLAVFVAIANVLAALVVPTFAWSAKFTDYRVGLVTVAVGAAFLGAILPLVSHFGIPPDERAGSRLSYVYLANILGSSAGSLITGFVLMDRMGTAAIGRLLAVAGFALAAAIVAMSELPRRATLPVYGALGLAALSAHLLTPRLYDRLYERLIYKFEYDGSQRFSLVVENKSGVITIAEDGTIYGGGTYDGVINTALQKNDLNGILRAYVVGALHPAPKEVLMVGLSGGSWAQVVAHLPGVERLTIVEINPGYLDVVKAYPEVSGLLRNPKVSIVFDDGRRWLQRHPDRRFDAIVMNTTLHWRAHATNILSTEFMNIARKHLGPGGVLYFNTTDSYDVQLTAARAFRHFKRITNFVAVGDDPFDFDRQRWRRLLETMTLEGKPVLDLSRKEDRDVFEDLLGFNDMEPAWSVLDRYAKTKTVVTDDNMVIEWREPLRYPKPE